MIGKQSFLEQSLMLLLTTIALGCSTACAQVTVTEVESDEPYGNEIEVIEMTVTPAAQHDPIFTHRLTWLPHETTAGNAASVYMHSLGENALSRAWKKAELRFGDDVYNWSGYDNPRDKIPLDKLKEASQLFDEYIEQHIDRATKRRDCDWGFGLEDLEGELVYGLHLNGLQDTRSISRALALQTKLAIFESRFEDAIDLLRMNYRLGENVGRVKMLVGNLIGIAEVGITNGNMVDFIAAPDSPNMYWALTELPRPIIDLRGAFRMECRFVMRMFPVLENVEKETHSSQEWARMVGGLLRPTLALSLENYAPPKAMKFLPTAIGIASYGPAKQRLIDGGMEEAKVESMAVGQVILVDASREFRQLADLVEKEAYLPFPEANRRGDEVEDFLRQTQAEALNSIGKVMATLILPAAQQVRKAEARTQRDIDALRVIEALRMHAAKTGKFPKTLDDISVVPIPENPATGKPFEYRLNGETAILELPESDGIIYAKRLKITLR